MKVVILHDWLTVYRGGERVLEAICEMFPDAPIYTLLHDKGTLPESIENREIVTSFLDKIPGIYKNYRKFLPFMPLAADMMKITHECDLVISSSHCVIKGIKKPKGAKHLCYIHTPMRYIYDQFDSYFGNASLPIKIAAHLVRPYLKWWDKRSNKNVDLFLPNSKFVENRMHRFYGNDFITQVVSPFVDLKDFQEIQEKHILKENFYLMVTAFAPNKRLDLAIEAFNELGEELRIIGGGSEDEISHVKSLAKDNIKFLGRLSREEVIENYAKAKAFIFPGVEDFGITPLEANASGTPLIAFKFGGVLETQTDKTATFFNEPSKEALIEAIRNHQEKKFEDLISRSKEFSKEIFIQKIKTAIDNL